MRESEIKYLLNRVNFFRNLRQCYQVENFYLKNDMAGAGERENNLLKLQRLENEDRISQIESYIHSELLEAKSYYSLMVDEYTTSVQIKTNGEQKDEY